VPRHQDAPDPEDRAQGRPERPGRVRAGGRQPGRDRPRAVRGQAGLQDPVPGHARGRLAHLHAAAALTQSPVDAWSAACYRGRVTRTPLHFGHERYVDTLFDRIERYFETEQSANQGALRGPARGDQALVVGIYGPWGCGKTTWLRELHAKARAQEPT